MFRVSLLLSSAALLVLVGCGVQADVSTSEAPPPPVQVAPVERGVHPLPVRTSGRLAARAETPLAFKIGGVVDELLVDEGDRVRAGQPLARLNRTEINAQVREARSALDKARRDLERTTRLYRDSVATLEEKQNAETAVDVAEAQLERATFNRQYAVITAPESGPILDRRVEEGELVGPNVPVFVLGATERGWVVRAGLTDQDIVRVQRGDSAHVRLDAYPQQRFSARVRTIAGAADPRSSTYTVELDLEAPEVALKSGFVARVSLFPTSADTLTVVPASALISGNGRQGVFYVLDETTNPPRVRRASARILRLLDDRVVLPSDAFADDARVVTAGGARLLDGAHVSVVRDPALQDAASEGRASEGR